MKVVGYVYDVTAEFDELRAMALKLDKVETPPGERSSAEKAIDGTFLIAAEPRDSRYPDLVLSVEDGKVVYCVRRPNPLDTGTKKFDKPEEAVAFFALVKGS